MPKSTPMPTNSTAKATEIRLSASTIIRPTAAVIARPTRTLSATAKTIRTDFSARQMIKITMTAVSAALRPAPCRDRREFLVRHRDQAGQSDSHALVRGEAESVGALPDEVRWNEARLQRTEIKHRLHFDEALQLLKPRFVAAQQSAPGKIRRLARQY